LFQEGVEFFQENSLGSKHFIEQNLDTLIFSWMGDKVVNTLTGILISEGFKASNYAGVIEVKDATKADVERCLKKVVDKGIPSEYRLAEIVPEKALEKFDDLLPENLLTEGYGLRMFDIESTSEWLKGILRD
jgi:ATP-dependent Lhr-like helicase